MREVAMDRYIQPLPVLAWHEGWCQRLKKTLQTTPDRVIEEVAQTVRADFDRGCGYIHSYGYASVHAQVNFMRGKIGRLWGIGAEEYDSALTVVSTHCSRSVTLPVFRLVVPRVGTFYLRNNFFNWKISCELEVPVPSDTWGDLFDSVNEICIAPVYCEGFDPSWVHRSFAKDQQEFTVELPHLNEHAFTFMWALRLQMIRLGRVASRP